MRFLTNAWYISCGVSAVFFFCAHLLITSIGDGLCGNEIERSVTSPNGEYKAVVFSRSCGATTGFSAHISVIEHDKELPNDGGNVFVATLNNASLRPLVRWQDNDSIKIDASGVDKVFKAKTHIKKPTAVTIDYRSSKDISYAFE